MVAALDAAINVDWPDEIVSYVGVLRIFNIDVHSVLGLGCYEGANDPMLTTAAMFAGACALLLAGYVFDTKCRHRPIPEAVNKWVKLLMVLLFLAYPGMCLVTARVFECREIEGTWYKTSDVSIHCYEDGWIDDAVVAGTLILVYVIGYPLSAYIVLSRNEHKLWRIPKHDGLGDFTARYGSMYLRYEHKYYLWELLEMLRKLLLTAVIIYILPGSSQQVFVAETAAALFLVLHCLNLPFSNRWDNLLQALCLTAYFLTTLYGDRSAQKIGVHRVSLVL